MIKLRHNETISFHYLSKFNGLLPATYRVFSAISEALDVGANPGVIQDQISLERVQASLSGIVVQDKDQLIIEGKYYSLHIDGEYADIKRV